jgi:hypothetical protein
VYLSCTLRFEKDHRITLSTSPDICFSALLPRTYPGRVMSLGNPHAGMAEKYLHVFYRRAIHQQFDCELCQDPQLLIC